ncbi:MAG: hypothetical protein JOZ69_17240 [Myxococcales bacterium]|nr:hypothetical protein [Myxococcales bacterium]
MAGACAVVAAADGCAGDNGFVFDDAAAPDGGGPGASSSGNSGGSTSSSGSGSGAGSSSSGGGTCPPATCRMDSDCRIGCSAPAGAIYCCDLRVVPGTCYSWQAGACPTTAGLDATVPPMDATVPGDATMPPPACTGRASCGQNQVCCLTGGTRSCQRNCAGQQVCAGATDCTAPEICGPAGTGGVRTCQNAPADAMTPVDAAGDGEPRDAAREASPDAQPTPDAALDAPAADAPADAPVDAPADVSLPLDSGPGDGAPEGAPADTGAGGG